MQIRYLPRNFLKGFEKLLMKACIYLRSFFVCLFVCFNVDESGLYGKRMPDGNHISQEEE